MKIAFIGQRGLPAYYGGVERRVEELSTRMVQEGHNVFVYCRHYSSSQKHSDQQAKTYQGVNLIYLPTIATKNLDTIVHTFLATLHALFQSYDIIHYQAPGPSSLSWIIRLFKPGTVVIATYNSKDQFHQKWSWIARWYLRLGERIICTIPHRTIATSRLLKQEAAQKYRRSLIYIPNGATVCPTQSIYQLKRWGLRRNRYILCINRFVKHKGIHFLIKAFQQLEAAGDLPANFKLVLVGSSQMLHTSSYEKYLKKLAGTNSKIIFTGTQKGAALSQLYSHAALFVQPSQAEGLSTVIMEAFGYGKAVIASDIPENLEAIGSRQNALVFKNRNVTDLAQKLKILTQNPQQAKSLGQKSKRYAREHYKWDENVKKTLKIYRQEFSRLQKNQAPKRYPGLSQLKSLYSRLVPFSIDK